MATNPVFDTLTVLGATSFGAFTELNSAASATLNASAPVAKVTNGVTTADTVLAFATTTGITVGMTAYGTGIPDGAKVVSTTSTTVTVDQTCTVALGAAVNFIAISLVASFSGEVADDYRLRFFDYRYAAGNTAASATRRLGFDNTGNQAGFIDFNPSGTPVLGIGSGPPWSSNYGFYLSASGAVTLPKGATISAPALMTVAYASGANPSGLKHVFNFSTSPIDNFANPTLNQTNITTTTNNHEIWANFDSTIHNVSGGDAATAGNIVSRYVQAIRSTASAVPLSALISNAIDATGLASASSGPLSGLEVDVTANGLDNASGRRGIEIALGKYDNGGARPEARAALEVFSGSNSAQEIGGFGFHLLANFASPFRDAGLDFRGATAWAGAGSGTDMAIRFRSGHKVVWDTSANSVQRFNTTTGNLEISGIGGWGSTNVGRQLVLTTPNGFSNPALGLTDSTGSNIWAMVNDGGTLSLARMPALTNSSTAPVNVLSLATAGATFSAGVALAGNLYDIRLSGVDVTGVADAQSALQTWLNTLPKGSTVRIPAEGKVLISSADLTIPPGITIEGEGSMLETTAGIAGGLLYGPSFILTATTTIVMSSGAALRRISVLRQGLLAAPITSQVNAAVAAWAAEGVVLFTSAVTGSGTVLTFASTTGVTVGMPVRCDQTGDSVTVSAVTGTTVTLSSAVLASLPAQSPVRFGRSIAVRVPRATGGARLEEVMIVGFHTAVLTASGRCWLRDLSVDCNTILFCVSAGDAGYIQRIHAIPYYGSFTSGTGNNRVGPAYVFGDATGFSVAECTQVSWVTGFVVCNTSGVRFDRCWSEHNFTDGVVATTAFMTRGTVNVVNFSNCTASAASVGFDMQHSTGNVNLVGCISATVNNATTIGHYRLGANSVGTITAAMINSNSGTAVVVAAGVGWWKINGPMLGAAVASPWIAGLAADLARVETFLVRDQSGTTDTRVQTHLREKTWLTWDTSITPVDTSPAEALAVETLSASTNAPIQSWYLSGTKLGDVSSFGSGGTLGLQSATGKQLAFYSGSTSISYYVGGGNPALNLANHASSVATDYVQLGAESSGGAYIASVSPNANAPLVIGTGNIAGTLRLQTIGGPTTIGGTLAAGATTITGAASVSGAATLGSAVITGNASVGGTATIATAAMTTASVAGTATIATSAMTTASVSGTATIGTASITTAGVSGTATIGTAAITTAGVSGVATLGTATVTNNATVGGTLGVTGLATFVNATVGGTLGVTGGATLSGNASVGGTFGATGAATFGSAVTLAGAPTLNLHAATKAYVDSVATTGGIAEAPLNATTYGRLNGAWVAVLPLAGGAVTGASTFGSTLGVTGAATLSSTLGVTGAATFSSTVTLSGAPTLNLHAATKAYVDSSVAATGISEAPLNTTTYGRLNAAWVGVLGLAGGGAVSGATTFGSTLGVTGLTSLSTLNTSGLATLNSASVTTTLGVTGGATFSSVVAVNSILTVGTNTAVLASPLVINSAATNARQIRWQTAGTARWGLGLSSAAEAGSNAGADLALSAYSDTGLLLTQPILVSRSTGQITISGGLKASGAMGFFGATPVTRPSIIGAKAGNAALGNLLTALASLGLITDSTTA